MAGRTSNVNVTEDTSIDRVWARELSKLLVLAPPWVMVLVVLVIGKVFHVLWGQPGQAAWAVIGETVCTLLLAALAWLISHSRTALFRAHTALTSFCSGAWVTAATITGVGIHSTPKTTYFWALGGVFFALTWNLRHVIRNVTGDASGDPLNELFSKVRGRFGYEGAQLHTKNAGEHKIEATLELPSGEKTVDDAQKKIPHAEGALHFPPGSVTIAQDLDRADRAQVTIVDPRKMREPIPWPGPSRPGGSIAEPLVTGLWADFEPIEYVILNHHIQIMGMTGSAKSLGGGWNLLGEAMTRRDVAIFAADITKGDQTLGPLRPALHRFETDPGRVTAMLMDLQAGVKERTDHLAAKGLTNWEAGCGLAYWLIHLEEFPDIGDALGEKGMKRFLSMVKALRSAGGTIVMSLQRSDWTQMPTIARGQLAQWCFGVADEKDAMFGLSPAQAAAGAAPELWGNKQPGMLVMDGPPIPEDRIALPARKFLWTSKQMADHAAQWLASEKTVDELTARIAAGAFNRRSAMLSGGESGADVADGAEDDELDGDPIAQYQLTEDPNPDITATIDDPIEDDPDEENFTFDQGIRQKMTPEEARSVLLAQMEAWAKEDREDFTMADLMPVLEKTGMSRQWALKQLKLLMADDVVERDEETRGRYLLRMPAAV
jgi:hypothetical protein